MSEEGIRRSALLQAGEQRAHVGRALVHRHGGLADHHVMVIALVKLQRDDPAG
jgi:hypothetical protein